MFTKARFGQRKDESLWMSFGDPLVGAHEQFDFDGSPEVAEFIVRAVSAHSEAIELLTAVTQSDGKVSDVLWNQIQAALKKWGEQ